jgi:hypothetical protein
LCPVAAAEAAMLAQIGGQLNYRDGE